MAIVDEHKTVQMTGDGPKAEFSKVSFSPDQQARVQELIDDTYKKAYSKAMKGSVSQGEAERLMNELGSLREDRKSANLLRAISRHNVVDAGEVAELLRPSVGVDDSGTLVAMDVSLNGGTNRGVTMGIDEYVDQWLSERPHHLRSSGSVGSGSRGAMFGRSRQSYNLSDPAVWRSMPREDLDRLLNEGVNVKGVSGQVFKFKDVKNPFLEAKKRK